MKRLICILISLIFVISLVSSVFADGLVPVITKNPSSEAIAIGGKTWFIAHADNATGMTWELVDANGNIYSLAEAMAIHPGLILEALEGDTIAVSNVPASVNGWGVQATFYGQGGAVSTSPAYIYVGDFLSAYNPVIERYRIAGQVNIRGAGDAYEYNVSEWMAYYSGVGYALKDLDKNGIPELLISGIDSQYENVPVLFEVYTVNNNIPVQVLISWARFRFYLMTDNRIYHEASGGAAYSYFEFFKLNGDHLEFQEGYATANAYDDGNFQTLYHSSTWNGNTEEFEVYGDYNHPDQTWPIEFNGSTNTVGNLYETFGSQCWMPQLTAIR